MNKKEFLKLRQDIDSIVNRYQEELSQGYTDTLDSLKLNISNVFEKHAVNGVVSRKDWRKYRGKIEKELTNKLNSLTPEQNDIIRESIEEVYQESFYRSGWSITQKAMLATAVYSLLPKKKIDEAVFNKNDATKWTTRHRKNNRVLSRQLRDVIRVGIIQGHGYDKMARELTKRTGVGMRKAYTIVQTETGRAYSEAKQESMEVAREGGIITKKRWVSTLDSLTRHSHQDLDGQTIGIDEYFISPNGYMAKTPHTFGVASEDINCRCDVIEVFEGLEPTVRMARAIDNERGEIIPYTTYNEWKDALK